MADKVTEEQRSYNMSRIRSSENESTEIKMLNLFRQYGITGWRRYYPIYGKPDFVFRKERVAIFVDGCFWHGCKKCYQKPKHNAEYWEEKLKRNKKRDKEVNKTLQDKGWTVIRIWEHSLSKPSKVISGIRRTLKQKKIIST